MIRIDLISERRFEIFGIVRLFLKVDKKVNEIFSIGLGKGVIVFNDMKYFIRVRVETKHVWTREYYDT